MNTDKLYYLEYNIVKRGVKILAYFTPQKQDKEVISIRLPSELLKQIDMQASAFDISRNEFINQCIAYAIENIKTDGKDSK